MSKDKKTPQQSGDNTTSNPKNKTWEDYSKNNPTSRHKEANKLFQNLNFADEWKLLYNGSKVTKIVCGLASFASLFLCFYFALSIRFPFGISVALSALICGLIEVFKAFSWGKLAKYVLKYKTYPFPLLAFAVGLNLFSVGGSAMGAYLTPYKQGAESKKVQFVPPVNLDSISSHYAHVSANFDQAINDLLQEVKKTSSNSTKRSLNAAIKDFQKAKAGRVEYSSKIIAEGKEQNSKALQLHQQTAQQTAQQAEENSKRNRTLAVCLTLLFELLLIGAYCFISFYLFRLHIDEQGNATEQHSQDENQTRDSTIEQTPNVTTEQNSTQPPNVPRSAPQATKEPTPRKIGFNQTPTATRNNTKTEQRSKSCDHCNKVFQYKNDSAKYCSPKCRNRAYRARK